MTKDIIERKIEEIKDKTRYRNQNDVEMFDLQPIDLFEIAKFTQEERDRSWRERIEAGRVKEEHHPECLNHEYPSQCDCTDYFANRARNRFIDSLLSDTKTNEK